MIETIIIIYCVVRLCVEGQYLEIPNREIDVIVREQAIMSSHLVEFLLRGHFSWFDFVTTRHAEGMLWGVDRIAAEDACVLDFHVCILSDLADVVKHFIVECSRSICERVVS